ncbi:MAG TPA: adenylyl-sulfate kinase [bacterium]|nr:adenylyl-sulfate kinase [bacterium]
MSQKGFTIWFTGLSGSGKTTVSEVVEKRLRDRSLKVEVLDGDVVRTNLSKGLGFSKEDRDTNILRIGFVCNLLTRNGVIAIAAAISPYRDIRDRNRELVGNFIEVFVDTPLDECERRDVKGLYAKARAGEIKGFTGIDDPYEAPLNPEVTLDTTNSSPEECADIILAKAVELGYLDDDEDVYDDEEEEAVKKRLEDLGYI